jgi:hypothetical protein
MSDFQFNMDAPKIRISDAELIESIEKYAEIVNGRYFPTTEYDKWPEKVGHSATIIDRFGSWNKALQIIGIEDGRERSYSTDELIDNLETIWKELKFPPGKRQLSAHGKKISERPYIRNWGSVKNACEQISLFHQGKITLDQLLLKTSTKNVRKTIPLNIRWKVLKRDNYTCVKCGKSPGKDKNIELEIDHIIPVSKNGSNEIENLQTLCYECNQGKKDKE